MTTPPRWHEAEIEEIRPAATSIAHITVRTPFAAQAQPGSHIEVRLVVDGATTTRSYSVATATARSVELGVFRAEASRGGSIAMGRLRAGDRLQITAPLQNFPLRLGAARYVILAGGIGITAVKAMASRLRRAGADYRVVYAGRDRPAMAFVDDLVHEHGEHLTLHIRAEGGSLDVRRLVGSIDAETELYMCGPIRLMDAVRREWLQAGLPSPNLRYETFGNSGWYDPEPFVVTVPRLGIRADVPAEMSMLDALERAGADMMSDCRKGECGLCEVRVLGLEGAIDHRDVFYSERQKDASGKLCCCVSRVIARGPSGGAVAIEIS